ncbi:MAG: hypothetical protein U0T36_10255 [Saprospiraceae bacterium]
MNNLEMVDIETLQYPIGMYKKPNSYSQEEIDVWIKIIDDLAASFGSKPIISNIYPPWTW